MFVPLLPYVHFVPLHVWFQIFWKRPAIEGRQAVVTARLHSREVQVAIGANHQLKFGVVEYSIRYINLTTLAVVASKPSAKMRHTPTFFRSEIGRCRSFGIGSKNVTRSRRVFNPEIAYDWAE